MDGVVCAVAATLCLTDQHAGAGVVLALLYYFVAARLLFGAPSTSAADGARLRAICELRGEGGGSTAAPTAQITFGGCGGMYNSVFGVAAVLQEHFHTEECVFTGVSAGCFPALMLALGVDVDEMFWRWNVPLMEEASRRPLRALFSWNADVRAHTLLRLEPSAHRRASGRLVCSLTRLPSLRNELHCGPFLDNEHLLDTMLASGFVPAFARR
jgi:hypothetical protein